MNFGRFLSSLAHNRSHGYVCHSLCIIILRFWVFKLLKAPLLYAIICLQEFWKVFEFLNSSKVTFFYLLKFVHKYVRVLSFKVLPKFMFYLLSVVYFHEVWKLITCHVMSVTICAWSVSRLHCVLKFIKGQITKFLSVLFQNQILYIVNQSGNGRSD